MSAPLLVADLVLQWELELTEKLQNQVTFVQALSGESQLLISKDKNQFRVNTLELNTPRCLLCNNEGNCFLWIFVSKKYHLISSPV